LIVASFVEGEEPRQCEYFSQRLKESLREDKKFCKELVDQCQYIDLLIDLCAQRREEHDLIVEKYVQCFEVSVEDELAKAYF
jgi:hypothetical protein